MTSHDYKNSQGLSKRANKRVKLGNQRTPLYRKEPEAVFRAGLGHRSSQNLSTMERQLGLFLLLLTLAHAFPATTPEPCQLDEDSVRCACNFSDPQPNWSSAILCTGAIDVEFYGGGRSLEHFLKRVNTEANPSKEITDVLQSLPWERLTLGNARVPAPMLSGVLRLLGFTSLKELTLENLEVTGTALPPLLEASGPNLDTLRLSNVSWATGNAWLAELQQWLKPGLKVLQIAQAHSLNFSCQQVRVFPALATLDLSNNPELGERGLISALCQSKFPALKVLALRNSGIETPSGVCSGLAAASLQLEELDLSHNSLRDTEGAPRCDWPSKLNSLNLSYTELEQVPKALPAKLSVLDLSYNRLDRQPRPDELPKVVHLSLTGNPFLDSEPQSAGYNSGVVVAPVRSSLAVGLSATLAALQGANLFA